MAIFNDAFNDTPSLDPECRAREEELRARIRQRMGLDLLPNDPARARENDPARASTENA